MVRIVGATPSISRKDATSWAGCSVGWSPVIREITGASTKTSTSPRTRDREVKTVEREELKAKIDELMRQYDDGEIDGDAYSAAMMELTASAQE